MVADAAPITPAAASAAPITKAEGRTDVANAMRLVAKHGEEVRWVGLWDKFLLWDGRHWGSDDRLVIDLKAKDVAADLFAEIANVLREGGRPDDKTLAAMHAHAKRGSSKDGVRNMIALAKSELAIGPICWTVTRGC